MDLSTAGKYARQIVDWLAPHCDRIEIAGSIRRERPQCADVDIVCIPKVDEEKDMLGAVISRSNRLFNYICDYVRERNKSGSKFTKPHIIAGGEREGMQMIVELPKTQLDLWFTTPEFFASRLLQRTGSKEHNIWFSERAQANGFEWKPSSGLYKKIAFTDRSTFLACATELELYRAIGYDYIEPQKREYSWLTSGKL